MKLIPHVVKVSPIELVCINCQPGAKFMKVDHKTKTVYEATYKDGYHFVFTGDGNGEKICKRMEMINHGGSKKMKSGYRYPIVTEPSYPVKLFEYISNGFSSFSEAYYAAFSESSEIAEKLFPGYSFVFANDQSQRQYS